MYGISNKNNEGPIFGSIAEKDGVLYNLNVEKFARIRVENEKQRYTRGKSKWR